MKYLSLLLWALVFCLAPVVVWTGDLDSPAAPNDAESAMYTLEDIYNRLNTGANGTQRTGTFPEPATGPTIGTGHTLNEVMDKAPAVDSANGAAAANVLKGKTFWGLLPDAGWGLQNGTLETRTLSNSSVEQPAGVYDTFNLSTVDGDLVARNIKKDVEIFGVTGSYEGESAYPARIPKTGQTSGIKGSDGDLQKGVAWPNPRFTKNGNYTVIDNLTGLMWLSYVYYDNKYSQAIVTCEIISDDGYTDWRLPNRNELTSLLDMSEANPALPAGHPFDSPNTSETWSSTKTEGADNKAWIVDFSTGEVKSVDQDRGLAVWPVRGGQ